MTYLKQAIMLYTTTYNKMRQLHKPLFENAEITSVPNGDTPDVYTCCYWDNYPYSDVHELLNAILPYSYGRITIDENGAIEVSWQEKKEDLDPRFDEEDASYFSECFGWYSRICLDRDVAKTLGTANQPKAQTKYLLISVFEREISTTLCDTMEQATDAMMDELRKNFIEHYGLPDDSTIHSYEEYTAAVENEWSAIYPAHSEYQTDDFGWTQTTAWSNLDCDNNADWKIVEIPG